MSRGQSFDDPSPDPWVKPPDPPRRARARAALGAATKAAVVLGVTALVFVIVFAVIPWMFFGGFQHTASDWWVAAARAQAARDVSDTSEWAEARLAPRFGSPSMRATVDVCHGGTQIFDNNLYCSRTAYLVYAIVGQWTSPDASAVAALLMDGTTTTRSSCDDGWDGSSKACLQRNGRLTVQVNPFSGRTTGGKVPDSPYAPLQNRIVWDGYDELEAATNNQACIVIAYDNSYFQD
jgi:hypothetical protein